MLFIIAPLHKSPLGNDDAEQQVFPYFGKRIKYLFHIDITPFNISNRK